MYPLLFALGWCKIKGLLSNSKQKGDNVHEIKLQSASRRLSFLYIKKYSCTYMPNCSCASCPHHTVVCFLFHSPIVSSFLSQSFFLSHKYTISNIGSLHPPTYSLFYSTISVFHSQTHFFLSFPGTCTFPPQHTTSLPFPRKILSCCFVWTH